ncbi:MAG: leucine-rich repeat domain-containing protein [Bacteroidales bacterium]|nr:leucine-rich repeat domain-containing protein [Bacteroidales bacterium]
MKNYIKKIQVIIVLTIMFSFNVNAQMYHNGIFYIINESECTAEVSFGLDSYGGYSGDIVIPENIERSFDNKIFTVKSIGVGAFSECFNLTSIEIPNTVTEICGRAFNECLRLTKFKIPSSVMTIANYAFYDCVSLAEIVCLAVVPPRIQSSNVFEGVDKSIPLYVRKGSKISYETADYWNEFTNIIEVETDGGEITPDINTCFEYNGLTYKITKKGEEVEVTYCEGKKYSGDITIPKTIAYNGVTYNVTVFRSL